MPIKALFLIKWIQWLLRLFKDPREPWHTYTRKHTSLYGFPSQRLTAARLELFKRLKKRILEWNVRITPQFCCSFPLEKIPHENLAPRGVFFQSVASLRASLALSPQRWNRSCILIFCAAGICRVKHAVLVNVPEALPFLHCWLAEAAAGSGATSSCVDLTVTRLVVWAVKSRGQWGPRLLSAVLILLRLKWLLIYFQSIWYSH